MGFEWGPPGERPDWAYDTYTGRPIPPWPPTGRRVETYSTCLACSYDLPRAKRCGSCPLDTWQGRTHDGPRRTPPAVNDEPFMRRVFRRKRKATSP